jgi:catechol 2,3-dioxygenase-like lactoylglutathione lyase family enzyme
MIGYITLGTNDKPKAEKFYDALMKELGISRILETEQFTAYGPSLKETGFSITKPFNGKLATVGNGTMVAFHVDSKEKVHGFYEKAIELGATDEGKPGFRGESGFYAAYFRDLDGHKLNAHTFVNVDNPSSK